jgi:hypothetical protein
MDQPVLPVNAGSTSLYFFISLLAGAVALLVGYVAINKSGTVGSGNWQHGSAAAKAEGFQGPRRGVSDIPCGQESSFVTNLSDLFSTKVSTTGDGEADLTEFKLILSKLCCMKHDLMSTNRVVRATLRIPFVTVHDREYIGDTVGRCFSNSLPPRDLDIIFETWRDRGLTLLDKLCTSYNLTDAEASSANGDFMSVWSDSYDVARTVCIPCKKAEVSSPRDPKGFMPEAIRDLGIYLGYY